VPFFSNPSHPRSSAANFSARVAQLMERWSYKPEVEGLSPSSGTTNKAKVKRKKDFSGDISSIPAFQFLPFTFFLFTSLLGA
jgi:hypothetical protein